MRQKLLTATTVFFLIASFSFSQNIKDAVVEYTNVKLPLTPLPASIKNYQVSIVAAYEEKNKKLSDDYQADLKKADDEFTAAWAKYKADSLAGEKKYPLDIEEYKKKLAAAEKKYTEEMEEYNKKSVGTKFAEKVLLNEHNKPTKNLPSEPYKHLPSIPYKRSVEKPYLQTTYDLPTLASTYFQLEQLQNNPSNALKIIVTLYGYDYTQPRVLSQQQNVLQYGSGNTSTRNVTYYHSEYSYRHPMAVKVITPDGKEILNNTPPQLNAYKISSSQNSTSSPSLNTEIIVKTTEEKILQEGLVFINKFINDRFGAVKEKRQTELFYVKSKGDEYADLTSAFNNASTALRLLADDSTTAKPQLLQAIDIWNKAIQESDINNKKARIDKDVTIAVCFNLLEANLAIRNHAAGMLVLQKLNTIDLSNKERVKKAGYESDYSDLKKRLTTN
jgi:hypothetical protein